ncbi:P-loop NTPase fold protein [Pantoea sp.]|uniref:KAP family P-loop NTPase fold protein n=1 Tax=Pantoea sp. TaxID=69393 RepID=UPI0031D6B1D6
MSAELIFDWSSEYEHLPADSLSRSKHAEFLTEFLLSKAIDNSYVLNLNASWGAGKSWFLRRWLHVLEGKYPTVYIDCWANDHSNDPLLTVVSEIRSCLIKNTDKKIIESSGFKKSWRLFKNLAPIATKTIIKNKLGLDIDGLEDIEDLDELGEKVVDELIKSHVETNESIGEFKKSITEWLRAVLATQDKIELPLFVFIDELDRCRPTYAIQMLETVKHLFDITNVVFVIATDKEQLQHSIRAVYGDGFNSGKYLDRFFHRTVTLSQQSLKVFIENRLKKSNPYIVYDEKPLYFINLNEEEKPSLTISSILIYIADYYRMDLRTANLWLDRVDSAIIFSNKPVDLFLLSFLIATEMIEYDLYGTLIYGSVNKDEIFKLASSRYRKEGIDLTYSLVCVDQSIIPGGAAAFKPYDSVRQKYTPLNLISMLIHLLRNKYTREQPSNALIRLSQNISRPDINRNVDITGENISLPTTTQYRTPLLIEISYIDFHLNNSITLDDYRNLCELAMTIE